MIFTVMLKLLFFPLADKSYRSMAKMKGLQPQMTALREQHGDDRQKLNQEMMALYKREKVNPAAGCLPILVQIPVFIALYQAVKVLGYIGRNAVFSQAAVRALRTIRWCALAVIGFVAAEEAFIVLNHGSDDAAGGIMMGVFIAFGSIVVAAAAAMFERILQNAVDIKSENDLTV